MKAHTKAIIITALLIPFTSFAGEADVVNVKINKTGIQTYSFDVTVLHADSGWEHYANKWDIIDNNGNILGTRVLYHPHENEQPFTRSLAGVHIPQEVRSVTVRAHDLVHQYGGKTVEVRVPE